MSTTCGNIKHKHSPKQRANTDCLQWQRTTEKLSFVVYVSSSDFFEKKSYRELFY